MNKIEAKLSALDAKFEMYLRKKASLENGKFYFEQLNNGREVEHYEMQLFELAQSADGIAYERLRAEILASSS